MLLEASELGVLEPGDGSMSPGSSDTSAQRVAKKRRVLRVKYSPTQSCICSCVPLRNSTGTMRGLPMNLEREVLRYSRMYLLWCLAI